MNRNKVLFGCGAALVVTLLASLLGAFLIYRSYLVPVGRGFLESRVYLEENRLGPMVTDIRWGDLDPREGFEIAAVGPKGALLWDPAARQEISFHPFESNFAGDVEIIPPREGYGCRYLSMKTWDAFALYDAQGRKIWRYSEGGPNSVAAGDIRGDGTLTFAAGYNGSGGVVLFDENGNPLWRKEGANVWQVGLLDAEGDGDIEILHSNAAGEIVLRDANGEILSRVPREEYFSHFAVVRWPVENARDAILVAGNGKIVLLRTDGGILAEYAAPSLGMAGEVRAVPVRLRAGETPYHAVLVRNTGLFSPSCLLVFDSMGRLVYHERFRSDARALAAVPGASGAEILTVGVGSRILAYEAPK